MIRAITRWLEPLRPILDPAGTLNWSELWRLDTALDTELAATPVGPDLSAGTERSRRLLAIRRALADHRSTGSPIDELSQLFAQFQCGYRDVRDATGLGHGELIARHGTAVTRRRWLPRLHAGELVGIAVRGPRRIPPRQNHHPR